MVPPSAMTTASCSEEQARIRIKRHQINGMLRHRHRYVEPRPWRRGFLMSLRRRTPCWVRCVVSEESGVVFGSESEFGRGNS
jgi:hypothetical protein